MKKNLIIAYLIFVPAIAYSQRIDCKCMWEKRTDDTTLIKGRYEVEFYDEEGCKITEYRKGKKDGIFRIYNDGRVVKGQYRKDNKVGIWKTYLPDDFLYKKIKYSRKGKVKSSIMHEPMLP